MKDWMDRGDSFVLEEDGDSGHKGVAARWKRQHGVQAYYNVLGRHPRPGCARCLTGMWRIPGNFYERVGRIYSRQR